MDGISAKDKSIDIYC